ncbi:MmcQ/YjbR family DNA-binding protein [Microlunatus parietis]|uniref:MmcQ/YjbR family DNA-binding protein n=1 Tax=Microlunatus parietis TaxID=682979 RepID=A0A7Y9I7E7_9ACTN|nr:MmcQ/YjbR family DNA-binding protein [Microlunatus parietis]NYE71673.1 hypothetical protein [Microlunatus parietis]
MDRLRTWDDVQGFLAALPGAEFHSPGGHFPRGVIKVRGKVVSYPAGGERGSPPDAVAGEEFVFVKAGPDEKAALLDQDPVTFFVTPHYAGSPGVIVRLRTADQAQLRELLVDAWRLVAPVSLVREYEP